MPKNYISDFSEVIRLIKGRPEHRKKGFGKKVIEKAVEIAKEKNCYKVMLMTGRKDDGVLAFYEACGFEQGVKTGLIMKLSTDKYAR